MGFFQAIRTCFAKFWTFEGRAQRSEYWWFVLFVFLATFLVEMSIAIFAHWIIPDPNFVRPILTLLLLSASVQRMHDGDLSGGWLLLPLLNLDWLCQAGARGPNSFGPDPLGLSN